MPPKISVTKENIIDATIELIREQGSQAISARKIASQLGCSSQPIYRVFSSMEELATEVHQEVHEREIQYAIKFWEKDKTLVSLLDGFMSYAMEEKNLRDFIEQMQEDKWDLVHKQYPFDLYEMMDYFKADPILSDLPSENIENLILNLIIYLHGLANLLGEKKSTPKRLGFDEETRVFFREKMTKAVEMFVLAEKRDLGEL